MGFCDDADMVRAFTIASDASGDEQPCFKAMFIKIIRLPTDALKAAIGSCR